MRLRKLKKVVEKCVNRIPINLRIMTVAYWMRITTVLSWVINFRENPNCSLRKSSLMPIERIDSGMNVKYFDNKAWINFEKKVGRMVNKLPRNYVKSMKISFIRHWDSCDLELDEISFSGSQLSLLRDYAILLCWAYKIPPCESIILVHLFVTKRNMNPEILLV